MALDPATERINRGNVRDLDGRQIVKLASGSGTAGGAPAAVRRLVLADGAATDSVGVKANYTVPAGKTATVGHVSHVANTGAPTVALQVVRGGANVTVDATRAAGMHLEAGDTIQWNVTTAAAAASTSDFSLSVAEY